MPCVRPQSHLFKPLPLKLKLGARLSVYVLGSCITFFAPQAFSAAQCSSLFSQGEKLPRRPINSPEVIGFHGTSRQALVMALTSGFLRPGHTERDSLPKKLSKAPALYFAEIFERMPPKIPDYGSTPFNRYDQEKETFDFAGAFRVASAYAHTNTSAELFFQVLGIPKTAETFHLPLMVHGGMEKQLSFLKKKYGLRDALLEKAKQVSEEQILEAHQGYVFALDKSVYSDFLVVNCGDEGLRIQLPQQGLPLKYVRQIIPLTQVDAEFLENLGWKNK